MDRISNIYQQQQFRRVLNHNHLKMEQTRRRIVTQKNIQNPHEDPIKTKSIMYYKNQIKHLGRYKENSQNSIAYLKFVESQMDHMLNILQKIRELSVASSNGIFNANDHQISFREIYQYIDEIIHIANRSFQGQNVFSGFQTDKQAFKVLLGKAKYIDKPLIQDIQYQGDSGKIYREIDKGNYIAINFPATEIFWTSKLKIISQVPATDYLSMSTDPNIAYQEIKINNVKIKIQDGDHLNRIVDKINQSNAPVHAYIDNTQGNHYLALEGDYPYRLILEDLNGSTVLQDLGIIEKTTSSLKRFSTKAMVVGKNLFEDLIELQNAFLDHSFDKINAKIGKMDMAIQHITHLRSVLGLKYQRVDKVRSLVEKNLEDFQNTYHKLNGVDMATAMYKLRDEESNYKVTLKLRSQLDNMNLFDFVK